jgi:hypothetical protein
MHWYQIYKSASNYSVKIYPDQIPEYIYGNQYFFGFITPDGDLYKCPFEGHMHSIRELEGIDNPKWVTRNNVSFFEKEVDVDWMKLGYIRIGCDLKGGPKIDFSCSPAAQAKHASLIREITNILKDI